MVRAWVRAFLSGSTSSSRHTYNHAYSRAAVSSDSDDDSELGLLEASDNVDRGATSPRPATPYAAPPRANYAASLQKWSGRAARVCSMVALYLVWAYAHGEDKAEGYLGGFNWREKTFSWHPVLMVGGMIVLTTHGVLSPRSRSAGSDGTAPSTRGKWVHIAYQTAAVVCTAVGLVAVFYSHNVPEHTGKWAGDDAEKSCHPNCVAPNLYTAHGWAGILSVTLFFFQYVSGVATFLFPTPPALKRALRPLHAFLGAGAYIGAAVAAAMGIAEKTGFGGRRADATTFTDDSPDYNPALHYGELKSGVRVAFWLGIFIVLTVLLALMAIDRGVEEEAGGGATGKVGGGGELSMVPLGGRGGGGGGGVGVGGAARYTMAQVEAHSSAKDCWIVVKGRVYDATSWLDDHPGGADAILAHAGSDVSDEFELIHSSRAWGVLEKYYVGDVVDAAVGTTDTDGDDGDYYTLSVESGGETTTKSKTKTALSKSVKRSFKLLEKKELSHDVRLFRFGLPSPDHELGLPTGNHIFLHAEVEGEEETVVRPYTPTTNNNQLGYFDLIIKVYFASKHPRFPNGGLMSQHLNGIQIGDRIEVKGPFGHIEYRGLGDFQIANKKIKAAHVGLICGGTGITPAYQVIQTALRDDGDETCFYVLLANQTEDDILLRSELDGWAQRYPDRVKIWYTLDRPPATGWGYSTGFIDEEMLASHMPPPRPAPSSLADEATKSLVLMCGPPPMIKFACKPNLEKLGFEADQLHCF